MELVAPPADRNIIESIDGSHVILQEKVLPHLAWKREIASVQ